MNRYIVKNCPSLDTDGITCQDCSFEGCGMEDCSNRNNCLTKELIEKVKDKIRIYEYYDKDYALGQVACAKSILQLFEIKECK